MEGAKLQPGGIGKWVSGFVGQAIDGCCWVGVADIPATDATAEFTNNRVVLIEAHLPRIFVRSRLPNST